MHIYTQIFNNAVFMMSDYNLILQNLHFITTNFSLISVMEVKDGKAVKQIVTLCGYGISESSLGRRNVYRAELAGCILVLVRRVTFTVVITGK